MGKFICLVIYAARMYHTNKCTTSGGFGILRVHSFRKVNTWAVCFNISIVSIMSSHIHSRNCVRESTFLPGGEVLKEVWRKQFFNKINGLECILVSWFLKTV